MYINSYTFIWFAHYCIIYHTHIPIIALSNSHLSRRSNRNMVSEHIPTHNKYIDSTTSPSPSLPVTHPVPLNPSKLIYINTSLPYRSPSPNSRFNSIPSWGITCVPADSNNGLRINMVLPIDWQRNHHLALAVVGESDIITSVGANMINKQLFSLSHIMYFR